jgi:DNA polymerase-3 subunit alpha
MQIASELGGFSLGEADLLRRAMGKKKPEEMEKQSARFMEGAKKKGIDAKKAQSIFAMMEFFAGYGFNKSHSAAYALITYRTAYLKAHYPAEFMAALLTSEMDNSDKITQHIGVCKEMELSILPPDINTSRISFTVIDGDIRFGMGAIKNVGLAALEEILSRRDEDGDFTSIEDLASRVDLRRVNRRVLESLIKSGAFDSFEGHRAQLMWALDGAMERGQKAQRDKESGQITMFEGAMAADNEEPLPHVEEWSEHERLAFEHDSLGFYVTGHPLEKYGKEIERYVTVDLGHLHELSEEQEVHVAGMKQSMKEINTRKGDRMAFMTLEDLHGSAEVIIFADLFKKSSAVLSSEGPFIIKGTVDSNGDKPKVKAAEVHLLGDFRKQMTRTVQVNLTTLGLSADDLNRLKGILEKHQGDCGVRLKLTIPTKSETIIQMGETLKVASSDEMVDAVESVFGHGSVTFL